MDLRIEAQRLTLDVLAVRMSEVLTTADVPHALLKGPTTAAWLYDPPRAYRDVDMLIPASAADRASAALAAAGVAHLAAGRVGEEAPHSLILRSTDGYEIDLHVSLPTVPVAGDRVWQVLSAHVEPFDTGVGMVPALDASGRCLTIALHALNNGQRSGQPFEDLQRAHDQALPPVWAEAAALADRIDARDLFDEARALIGDRAPRTSPRARLYAMHAPSAALGLERLASVPLRELPRAIWRELFPSVGFMRYSEPASADSRVALARAYVRRLWRLTRQMPSAVRAWRSARGTPIS